jgi:hypothetical protein
MSRDTTVIPFRQPDAIGGRRARSRRTQPKRRRSNNGANMLLWPLRTGECDVVRTTHFVSAGREQRPVSALSGRDGILARLPNNLRTARP